MLIESIVIPEKVKIRFEKRQPYRSYEEWFNLFASNCNTFTEIAKKKGISYQAVQQIYKKHFAPFLPEKNGRERQKIRTIHKAKVRFARAQHKFPTPLLKKIAQLVKAQGYTIMGVPVVHSTSYRTNKKEIVINGKLCQVHHIKSKQPNQDNVLVEVAMHQLWLYDFYIFYLKIKKITPVFFIIPKDILHDAPLGINKKGRKVFALPLRERSSTRGGWGRTRTPKVDWRQFKNAWHLLEV